MKLISWNVNGIRAVANKGFWDYFEKENADIFCIQETKMQEGQYDIAKDSYNVYLNSAKKKGYSGTAIWTKKKPLNVFYGINNKKHDNEGRVITLEFDNFFLVNCYTPNSQRELTRLDYRSVWENDFRNYLKKLKEKKSVILCGDLNVAHNEIDLKNPTQNRKSAGFTDKERQEFSNLLDEGFVDTFRFLYPNDIKYSWWSYITKARERNAGWRIDYFVISMDLKEKLLDARIRNDIYGSDHCPVEIDIKL